MSAAAGGSKTEGSTGAASERGRHWDRVFREKDPTEVSWYEPRLETSLALVRGAALPAGARVLDVGGGASTLVEDLLEAGFRPGVLDVSAEALERARERLGARAAEVEWYRADVTGWRPPHLWDLWHDRATFHFLTEDADREAYRRTLLAALAPGGAAVISGFGPEGPTRCSGLPVRRLSADDLEAFLAPDLSLEECMSDDHRTPSGRIQPFLACRLRRA